MTAKTVRRESPLIPYDPGAPFVRVRPSLQYVRGYFACYSGARCYSDRPGEHPQYESARHCHDLAYGR